MKTLRNITTPRIRNAVKLYTVFWILILINILLDYPLIDNSESLIFIGFLVVFQFVILTEVIIRLFDYTGNALDKESLYSLRLKEKIKKLEERYESTRRDYIESKHLILQFIESYHETDPIGNLRERVETLERWRYNK